MRPINSIVLVTSMCLVLVVGCAPMYQQKGYANEGDYQFSQSVGNATPQRISTLRSYGVNNKQQLDDVIGEMNSIKYSDNNSAWDNIFNYLSDRAAAQKNKISVMQQKKRREAQEKADKEKKAADELRARKEYAKNFPYTATIACQINGRHTTLAACFLGKHNVNTQLEIKNGNSYKLYQPWELQKLGRESREGLIIPLNRSFDIVAQNASDSLTLTIVITDTATGNILMQKSAAQWGKMRFTN